MLYELIAVVRPGNLMEVKEIARTTGALILNSGGTIRGIKNWGIFSLPKRTRKHQAQYTDGHYFIMRYDSSSKIQDDVRKTLGLDPRMIKFSSVKLGDGTLESLSKIGGVALELGQDERGEMNAGIGEKLDDEVVQMNRGAVYQSIVRRKVDGSLQLDIALKMNDRIQT